jgi:acetyl-CoA carboxylase alpha subunit
MKLRMANPEGYQRCAMKMAEKFGIPVLTLILWCLGLEAEAEDR